LLLVRRLPQCRQRVRLTAIVLVVGVLLAGSTLLAAGSNPAAASPSSARELQQRLEDLNRQADQQVEDYLQAQLAVRRTQGSIRILHGQLAGVRRQLADARASIAARAAVAYVQGPATDVASLLAAGDPSDALERAQLLDLLATRDTDQLLAAGAIEHAAQRHEAELAAAQRQQAAVLDQMAARKARIEQLVSQTQQTLDQLRAAGSSARCCREPARPQHAAGSRFRCSTTTDGDRRQRRRGHPLRLRPARQALPVGGGRPQRL